jgi:SAM-dependent methyltransferase
MIPFTPSTACRICGSTELTKVLDLGQQPLANSFLSSPEQDEAVYPLELMLCAACIHLQLSIVVDRQEIFSDYIYSSRAATLGEHWRKYADDVMRRLPTGRMVSIVEIGSNDGLLLEYFSCRNHTVLGIDPAENIPASVPTQRALWSLQVAREIETRDGRADAILANNVFAHIEDLNDAVAGMSLLLTDDGIAVIELPWAEDLWERGWYDSVYHEHLSLFGTTALSTLFERHGLFISEVQLHDVQGTSLRAFAGRERTDKHDYYKNIDVERRRTHPLQYKQVTRRVEDQRNRLRRRLDRLKGEGKRIVGYGAPAKGNTMLNYTGAGEFMECLIDDMPSKQGKYAPGSKLPVRKREEIEADVFVLMAWNVMEAIQEKEKEWVGEWVHPFFA